MKDDKARFMARVAVEQSGCWRWTGFVEAVGYGRLGFRGRREYAHRASFMLFRGDIPSGPGYHGTCVCHRCDNRLCVNPDHLFLGTQAENVADMVAKGRGCRGDERSALQLRVARRGADHHMTKLTAEQVLEIRRMAANGLQRREIAERFGVCDGTISDIKKRKSWKHI